MKELFITFSLSLFFLVSAIAQKDQVTFLEIDNLNYLYEEERLAHDIYTELSKRWELSIFENIAQSEKRHYDHLLMIYEKYGLSIPKLGNGFYNYPELNFMYDRFFEGGMVSLESALTLAANFEEYDIVDLERYLKYTQNVDLILVYNSLLEGSKNHLRAIYRNIQKHGFEYEPVLLEKKQLQEILEEMSETGTMKGKQQTKEMAGMGKKDTKEMLCPKCHQKMNGMKDKMGTMKKDSSMQKMDKTMKCPKCHQKMKPKS